VRITARTAGSAAARTTAARSASFISTVSEFIPSGRFSVIVPTPSVTLYSTVSDIVVLSVLRRSSQATIGEPGRRGKPRPGPVPARRRTGCRTGAGPPGLPIWRLIVTTSRPEDEIMDHY
jgi:hypothetical protein